MIFIYYIIFSSYLCEEYQLLFHKFLKGEFIYEIKLINKKSEDNKIIYYYGLIEDIQSILKIGNYNKEKIINAIKDDNPAFLYIKKRENLQYINLFPTSINFIILDDSVNNLKNGFQNYNIFSISHENNFLNTKLTKNNHYIKVGKKIDVILNKFLFILLFISTFISLIISFIMKKILNNLDEEFHFAVHYIMRLCSFLLIISNITNSIFFLFYKNREYCFIMEYTTILIYSFYKSNLIPLLILILLGWGTVYFGWGQKFKKLNRFIFLFDLFISFLIPISVYFIGFTDKLDLFVFKNILEYLVILCVNIFSIFKRVIPLSYQLKYEQRIGSNLANNIEFKYNKLVLINIIIITYTIFMMISPILDYNYINYHVNNYNIYFIFQLFYETIFNIFFFIVFFHQRLPEHYFEDVVFKYKFQVFYVAKVNEEEYNPSINDSNDDINNYKKLNISNLSIQKLRQIIKNNNPILMINPYTTSKSGKLFKELHLGVIKK